MPRCTAMFPQCYSRANNPRDCSCPPPRKVPEAELIERIERLERIIDHLAPGVSLRSPIAGGV